LAGGIAPASKGETGQLWLFSFNFTCRKEPRTGSVMVVFLFSVLGAAVFAEPTVTKIEEVIGLIHKGRSHVSVPGAASCCARGNPIPNA